MNEADGGKGDREGDGAGWGGGGFAGKGGGGDSHIGLGEIVLLVYMPTVKRGIKHHSKPKAEVSIKP